MRKRHCRIASIGIFTSLFALSACVDNGYDLNKDVDMTISIGGSEFAIPGGYTDKWTLDQVLDLDTTGIVKADKDGNYSIVKKGDDVEAAHVSIKDVTVDAPDIADIDIDLSLQPAASKALRAVADSLVSEIPDGKKTSFTMTNDDMPVELLTMSYVTIRDMKITLNIAGPAKLSLRDMQVKFPDYIDIEGVKDGVYKMPANAVIGNDGLYSKPLSVIGMRIGDAYTPLKRLLQLSGDITVQGKLWMAKADINNSQSRKVVVAVKMDDMKIETVTGKVNPEIDIKVEPVQLTDIPDFLNDDQVRLDLDNPMILLRVDNESPVDVNAIGKFVSKKGGKIIQDTIYTDNIPIKGNTNNLICLSQTGTSSLQGYVNVKTDGLSKLLERIPDEIVFTIDAYSDTSREFTMRLGNTYDVQPGYKLDAPLAFGKNLLIVYNDTIDGWNSDIEDFEVSKVNMHTDIDNGIPLNVVLSAVAIDMNADPLPGIEATVNKEIAAGTGDVSKGDFQITTTTGVVIELVETVPGTIKKLDGIMLKAEAKSDDKTVGKILNENQYLQLRNIKLKVPGGLKVDLN